jgi:hypothetical protein
MKPSRTFWFSSAATAALIATVVAGSAAASAHEQPSRAQIATSALTAHPAGPGTSHLGKMIHTGLDATQASEWVIKAVPVTVTGSTKKTFGFAMDDRANNGELTEYMVISEASAGAELKAGFHAVEHVYGYEDEIVQPAYGYFVGNPAKITGTVNGKQIRAKTARWSANSKVTVFWFDNTKVTADSDLTAVSAYDAGGKLLAKARVYSEGE